MARRQHFVSHRKRHGGFTLIEMSIVVAFVAVLTVYAQKIMSQWAEEAQAEMVKTRIEFVLGAIDRAYIDLMISGEDPMSITSFPASLTEMVTNGYIPDCPVTDSTDGLCIDYLHLPIGSEVNGEPLVYTPVMVGASPAVELSFSVATVPASKRELLLQTLGRMPGYSIDASFSDVTITQHRPGSIPFLQSKVSRDGTTPMTADWDYGNFDLNIGGHINMAGGSIMNPDIIYNARDITIAGMDRTAINGLTRMGQVEVTNINGQLVSKPSCPANAEPKIAVWSVGTGYQTDLIDPTNVQVWPADENASQWRVHARINVQKSNSTTREYVYDSVVAYATWCDFKNT